MPLNSFKSPETAYLSIAATTCLSQLPQLCEPHIFPPAVGWTIRTTNLVFRAVSSTFWINYWLSALNHFNKRPKPWWAIFVVSMQSIYYGASLNIHRIYEISSLCFATAAIHLTECSNASFSLINGGLNIR